MNVVRICLVMLLVVLGGVSRAHDASSYGGVYRSRDFGRTWLHADTGLFLNAPLAVAVNPQDPLDLLMGTDLGLLSSRNGGRGWTSEADTLITGAIFSVVFLPDGNQALCAGQGGVFRYDGTRWVPARVPSGAMPARTLAVGIGAERIYLLAARGLFSSVDGGRSFKQLWQPAQEITALVAVGGERETLLAVVGGALMTSDDGGTSWRRTELGSADEPVDAIAADATRVWAAHADHLYASEDRGATWAPAGRSLPERGTKVNGIAADAAGTTIVLTTHRGTFRSSNGGQSWALPEADLPAHLEAGPLTRDPGNASILYVAYALVPYAAVWRAAVDGGSKGAADPMTLASAASFVLLVLCGLGLAVRRLARRGPKILTEQP
jgi:photosystem II stability/assembly factor-like uncharacterized protein